MFTVKDAVLADVPDLLTDLRQADRDEWIAAGVESTGLALAASIETGPWVRTVRLVGDGDPLLCIYGVNDTAEPGVGMAWLIGTNLGQRLARKLIKVFTAEEMAAAMARWSKLECWSDSRNTAHHRWLDWMGFDWMGTVKMGPFGFDFEYFERYRQCARR